MHDPAAGLDWRLKRYPPEHDGALRAWDAADEYILAHCREQGLLDGDPGLLLVNDAFGALAVALHGSRPTSWGDSYLGLKALELNLRANGLDPAGAAHVPADADPAGVFDLVLIDLPGYDLQLSNRANVYSREGLDPGTRILLPRLPRRDETLRAADLGCGSGALSLALAVNCPNAAVLGVDESWQAVPSARDNLAASGLDGRDIRFEVGDGLASVEADSLDLVVCNPPFHQAHAVTDHIARRMFGDAVRALRIGGELLVVGNAHLGYEVRLREIFGDCEILTVERRFEVLRALRVR